MGGAHEKDVSAHKLKVYEWKARKMTLQQEKC